MDFFLRYSRNPTTSNIAVFVTFCLPLVTEIKITGQCTEQAKDLQVNNYENAQQSTPCLKRAKSITSATAQGNTMYLIIVICSICEEGCVITPTQGYQ